MLLIEENDNTEIMKNIVFIQPKINRAWGVDYILMDSNKFMGSTNGDGYKQVIDMFENVWNAYEYRLFSSF
ncbi:MAG: hypothetical protein LBU85_02950 [Treponema sp.]|jgi:hypothetical protein|nr:hypothetical protein [Treponema sp.]